MKNIFALDNPRIEKKFICYDLNYKDVAIIIKKLKYIFIKNFPSRKINNIYLDDIDRSNYYNSIEGISNRYKTRIRWYGNFYGIAKSPKLEIKSKRNQTGFKNSYKLKDFKLNKYINNENKLIENIKDNVDNNIFLILKDKEIASINNYERDYFISFDKKFRITIDYNINFSHLKFNKIISNRLKNITLIEIKCEEKNIKHLDRISNELPFKISRFSKYTEGIESYANNFISKKITL